MYVCMHVCIYVCMHACMYVLGMGNIDILVCDYYEAKVSGLSRLLIYTENCLQMCKLSTNV